MKKEFVKGIAFYIAVMVVIAIAFFVTRLYNLTLIPIFTDEAIYLRWGQIALADPRWRMISLIDGKQPLLIWLFLPALKYISDPLIAGRMVSVIAGFVGMIGLAGLCYVVTRSWRSAVIGAVLYLLLPFFLVYDRLALYDTLLTTIGVWSLLLTYLFGKTRRLDTALLLGSVIGAGLLTKSSANFFWMLLPLTLLLYQTKKKNERQSFAKWAGLIMVIILQSQIYNNILRLSEFRHVIGQKNLSFVYSFTEIAADPFRGVYGNLIGLTSWLVAYLTWPLTLLIVAAIIWYLRKNFREGLFFLGYFLIPFVGLAFFGRVIYPRFILFMLPPLLLMAAVYIEALLRKNVKRWWVLMFILALPLVYFDYKLLFDPIHAPMPSADRQQLITDWPAGYGIKEVVAYLETASQNNSIIVGTEGTFGLFPMALELYLGSNPNITFKAYWPVDKFPEELREFARQQPTFLVFKEKVHIPTDWPLTLIHAYQRGDGQTYLKFYRVNPET